MKQSIRTSAVSLLIALSSFVSTTAFSATAFSATASPKPAPAPAEVKSIQIKRSATTANPAVVTLSKNLFKTEEYQASYNVDVPYETTENYTVEIPYQTTETYTVQIPYQDTETYTESVPYQIDVPYTDYETEYRNEYQCQNVTRYRNECHNEQRCYIVPGSGPSCRDVQECGTNALGQQICKTRQVCDGSGSGPQQRCDNQNVCSQVPYNDQDCRNVQVPYQRQVTRHRTETRYRNETRTRTVTKYRNETRTREVTKTRTETRTRTVTKTRVEERCCVTKTREVFDRQLSFQVAVNFPQDAVLGAKETETITVSLSSADPAVIAVDSSKALFNYKIATQSATGASVLIDLAVGPKYDLTNAGESTIKDLKVDYSTTYSKFRITFTDAFKGAKVASQYMIDVTDAATGNLIESLPASKADSNGKMVTRITTVLDKKTKIVATIKVKRSSPEIADGALMFSVVGKN